MVTPFNVASNTFGVSIVLPVGTQPSGIAINPSGTIAYVVSTGHNNVTPINIPANTLGPIIGVGSTPFNIAITPDGKKAYVTNNGGASVSVLDFVNNTVASISLPGTVPFGVAITPDGTKAYITDEGSDKVYVIDTATDIADTAHPITVGAGPFGIAITPLLLSNVNGKQKNNDFGIESELFNKLTWTPSTSSGVIAYKIFRNGVLIGQVSATSKLEFEDHNRTKNVSYTYKVTALFPNGLESQIGTVIVP